MSIPTNKEELLSAITTNYKKLAEEFSNITNEQASIKELEGHAKGTLMSVNNLAGYLIGWGELVLKWNKKKQNDKLVDFPETGYKWNELGKLAQKFYEDYNNYDFSTLVKLLDQTVESILLVVERKSNEELYQVNWYEKWPLGRMIQFNTSSPYKNAKARIRKWKKEKGFK